MSGSIAGAASLAAVRRRLVLDRLALAACIVAGLVASFAALDSGSRRGLRPEFYQTEFSPAVMLACGRGYSNLAEGAAPVLDDFLARRRPSMSCADVPAGARHAPLKPFQRISINLQVASAAAFLVGGIAWSSLGLLYGVFGAMMGGLLYAFFRLASGPLLSTLASVALLAPPLYRDNVIHLRDFAKAPFLLAAIVAIGVLAARVHTVRALLWTSVVTGVVLGVGLGFRNDLMIAVPPVALTILALVAPEFRVRQRVGALAAFAAAFLVAASPTLAAYSKGSNTAHVILLGLTRPFDVLLGVEPAAYEFGPVYQDEYVFVEVGSEAARVHGRTGTASYGSAAYDRAAADYLIHVAALTPADLATRAIAAMTGVLSSGFMPLEGTEPATGLRGRVLHAASLVLAAAKPWVLPTAGLVVAVLALLHWRYGAAALLVLGVFAGGAALQFHPRHYFYLACLGYWPFTFVLSAAASLPIRLSRQRRAEWRPRQAVPGGILLLVIVAGGLGAMVLLRHYQARAVGAHLQAYASAPAVPIPFVATPGGTPERRRLVLDPRVLFPGEPVDPSRRPFDASLVRVTLGGAACRARSLPIRTLYSFDARALDFGDERRAQLPAAPGTMDLYIPAYRTAYYNGNATRSGSFVGFEVDRAGEPCVAGVARVDGLTRTPVWLSAIVGPAAPPPYQRLPLELSEDAASQPESFYVAPPDADASEAVVSGAAVAPPSFAYRSADLIDDGHGWRVDRFTGGQYEYVVTVKKPPAGAGFAVVRGLLHSGGITVGLLDAHDAWKTQVNVVRPGPFTVVLQLPTERPVTLVVANCAGAPGQTTRLRLSRLAWVAGAPHATTTAP